MIHTLIVDNDMLFRSCIRMILDSSSDIAVAGEASQATPHEHDIEALWRWIEANTPIPLLHMRLR